MKVMLKAGMMLLPDWAQQQSGYRFSALERMAVDRQIQLIAAALRWSIQRGAYHRAMKRVGRLH